MILKLEDKKNIITEVADAASKAVSAVVVDYTGLNVTKMTQLRSMARNNNIYLRVIRNTLVKRALENSNFSCLSDVFVGPVFLAFSFDDPGAIARLLKDAMKECEQLVLRAIALNGKLLDVKDLDAVAKLPTYNQSLAILMSIVKMPVIKLVRTIAEPYTMLVRTLAAIRDKKVA